MSYSCSLVVGIKLSDILRVESGYCEVTRYDEKTGAPYTTVISTVSFYLFGKEIKAPEEPNPEDWKYLDTLPVELNFTKEFNFYSSGYRARESGKEKEDYDYSQYVMGKSILDCDVEGEICEVPDCAAIIREMTERLSKLEPGVIRHAKLYVVSSAS